MRSAAQTPRPLGVFAFSSPTLGELASALQKGYSLLDRVVRAADVGVTTMPDEQQQGDPDDVGGSP